METEIKTSTINKLLRINIDGRWSSQDFSNLFSSLSLLYKVAIEIQCIDDIDFKFKNNIGNSELKDTLLNLNGDLYRKLNFPSTYQNAETIDNSDFLLSRFNRNINLITDLQIKEIKYSSPGHTDFIGFGRIVEQVFSLIKYYIPNKQQRLANQETELDILSKKITVLRRLGYDKMEIRKFYDVRDNGILNLKQLEVEGKITSFELKKIQD